MPSTSSNAVHPPVADASAVPLASVAGLPGPWRLLAERAACGESAGAIQILENAADGARLYVEGEVVQSHALPGGESLVPYVRAVRDLLLRAGARRIGVLGGAGGTLATMMARRGAESCVLVDINPDAFAVARAHFWLAPAVKCVVADARSYLEHGQRADPAFDAIVLDAYGRDGRVPPHLADSGFFRLAGHRLAPGGLLVANAFAERRDDPLPDALAAGIAAAGLPATIVDDGPSPDDGGADGGGPRNVLVIGGPFREAWLPLPGGAPLGAWEHEERFRRARPLPPVLAADRTPIRS
jgi:SAM-dependent methyltransferase